MDEITVEVRVERDCDTLKKTGTVAEIAAWIGGFGFTASARVGHRKSVLAARQRRAAAVADRGMT